jgi:hypothetical protein
MFKLLLHASFLQLVTRERVHVVPHDLLVEFLNLVNLLLHTVQLLFVIKVAFPK